MSLGSLLTGGIGALTGGAGSAMVPAMSQLSDLSVLPAGAGIFSTFPSAAVIPTEFSPSAAFGGAMSGAQTGFKYGSLADELLGTGQQPPLEPLPTAPPKKPLLPSPTASWQTSQALSSIPPELQNRFQNLFQTGIF